MSQHPDENTHECSDTGPTRKPCADAFAAIPSLAYVLTQSASGPCAANPVTAPAVAPGNARQSALTLRRSHPHFLTLLERSLFLARIRRQILEFGKPIQKRQLHAPGWAVALLRQNKLRNPLQALLVRPVNLFAENKAHHIRILLNTSRFAQIAQHRPMIAWPRLRCAAEAATTPRKAPATPSTST